MEDGRVWEFEASLWTGDAEHYRASIDDNCVMALPTQPFVMSGAQAIEAVVHTPRWSDIEIEDGRIVRPQEGLIAIAYTAHASKPGGESYTAYCTSTYRRVAHDDWRVVQHSQTLPPLLAE